MDEETWMAAMSLALRASAEEAPREYVEQIRTRANLEIATLALELGALVWPRYTPPPKGPLPIPCVPPPPPPPQPTMTFNAWEDLKFVHDALTVERPLPPPAPHALTKALGDILAKPPKRE